MNSIYRVLILLLFASTSFADAICFGNAQEYKLFKDKLPVLFREIPVKLGGESPGRIYDVFASIKISIVSDSIVLSTDSWQGPLGHYRDVVEVKSVCLDLDAKQMTISFKNNAKDFVTKFTDKEIVLPEITLKKITPADEKRILEKIYKKVPNKVQPKSDEKVESANEKEGVVN